jgi:acetoin utilization deacetylase AcuC-like enzyme
MALYFISHPDCLQHLTPAHHPERPKRLSAINDQLITSGVDSWVHHREAPRVTREQLLRVHSAAYLDELSREVPAGGGAVCVDGGDTFMSEHSLEAASRAAGAVVMGVDLVMSEPGSAAFCSVRPPGHHATRDRAMGFCLYNNIAVGAAHGLHAHGLKRVAIVDFDVHHGNGTDDIFLHEPRVLFCSTFQHPFYPHEGAEARDGAPRVNVPLPAGTRGEAFRAAVRERWLPALDAFRPQLLLISAGFDGHLEDDMAGLGLFEADYEWVTRELRALAERHAEGRIVSTLEGGYALSALGRSVVAHLKALL